MNIRLYTALLIVSINLAACEPKLMPEQESQTPSIPIVSTTDSSTLLSPTATPSSTDQKFIDSDKDGLSDANEKLAGTDVNSADTDGDTLTDYDEVTKYFTDPLAEDSDGDGVPDSDWEERREYTYTIKATIQIRKPYNIESMTDHYQDAVIKEESDYSMMFEVILYPSAYHIIEEIEMTDLDSWISDLEIFLAADPIMNYDEQMSSATQELFIDAEDITDLQVVSRMYEWEQANVDFMPETSDKNAPYPEPFLDIYLTSSDEIAFSELPQVFSIYNSDKGVDYSKAWDREWQLTHLILGKEMFFNQTHGSCGSTANFHSTVLRSLGIPTRIIQTIPVLNENDDIQVAMLEDVSEETRTNLLSRMGYNHFLVEAFIGNRWVRVNNNSIETNVFPGGAFVKIIAFDSWRNANFAEYWGQPGRPYKLLYIEDQDPVNMTDVYEFPLTNQ